MFQNPATAEPGAPAQATWDAVLDGSVRFLQPARGYRVNQDSVLLGAFAAQGRTAELAVDLGAGVGVVGLILYRLGAARRLALVERELSLVQLAERNLQSLHVPGEVIAADLEAGLPQALAQRASLVVMNPPFFSAERHLPTDSVRRLARHGALPPFLRAAAEALAGSRARAVLAYPARALEELFAAARAAELVPKRLRLVHPFIGRPARLALIELRRARPGGLLVEPPLVEWQSPGVRASTLSAEPADDRK